jgi:hypothetical protein
VALLGAIVRGGVAADTVLPVAVGAVVGPLVYNRWIRQSDEA